MQYQGGTASEAGRLLEHALLVYSHVTGKNEEEVYSTLADMGIETSDMAKYKRELQDTVLTLSNNMK